MERRSMLVYVCSILMVTLLLESGAAAQLTRTSFTGLVTANNPNASGPAIGTTITGEYVIDPSVTTGEGPNCTTSYCWSGTDAMWTWNDVAVTYQPYNYFQISYERTDVAPGTGSDVLVVHLVGYSLNQVTLTLTDPTGTAFESGGAPSAFSQREFSFVPTCLTGTCFPTNPYYSGDITDMTVTLVTPFELIGNLIDQIDSYGLDSGTETSLVQKLTHAQSTAKNKVSCNILQAFMNEVLDQTGSGLTQDQAAALTTAAQQIRTSLGCQ